jgi:hypothetical protein
LSNAYSFQSGDELLKWKFEKSENRTALESISKINDTIEGNFRFAKGITGDAIKFDGFTGGQYDLSQKAYKIDKSDTKRDTKLRFKLNASVDSPVVNPAFVIKNWGEKGVAIELNNKSIAKRKNYHTGYSNRMEGTDLLIWMNIESRVPVAITIIPTSN